METRKCIICKKLLEKKAYVSITCSKDCGYKYRSQTTQVWNKGLTKKSDERVKRNADALKGKPSWAKGIKGKDHPLYGRKSSKEAREKISKATSGKKHWNWQGGKTCEIHLLRNKIKYQEWRVKIFEKDGYKCTKCKGNKRLNSHHIKSFEKYPKIRYDVNNGQTLCNSCHTKIHAFEKKNTKKVGGLP